MLVILNVIVTLINSLKIYLRDYWEFLLQKTKIHMDAESKYLATFCSFYNFLACRFYLYGFTDLLSYCFSSAFQIFHTRGCKETAK